MIKPVLCLDLRLLQPTWCNLLSLLPQLVQKRDYRWAVGPLYEQVITTIRAVRQKLLYARALSLNTDETVKQYLKGPQLHCPTQLLDLSWTMSKDACWVGQQSTVLFDLVELLAYKQRSWNNMLMISVITVDLFNSLHVRQNHTTCTSVKGLSRLEYTIIPSLTSWKVRVNYLSKFGFFSWKLTCSGSTTLTRAGRPRPRYMQHIAETSWCHLILDKD